jgi:hypothetical protein
MPKKRFVARERSEVSGVAVLDRMHEELLHADKEKTSGPRPEAKPDVFLI